MQHGIVAKISIVGILSRIDTVHRKYQYSKILKIAVIAVLVSLDKAT